MDVVAYIRESTVSQSEGQLSLQTQRQKIRDYCKSHKRNIVRWFSDKVVDDHGKNEYPGLYEMLSELPKLSVKKLAVFNQNCLWIDSVSRVLIQRELRKSKLDVLSVIEPSYSIYKSNETDESVQSPFELLDRYERFCIAVKLNRGRIAKAKSGGFAGGKRPLGYKKNGSDIVIDKREAETIKRIFYLRRYKKLSLRKICEELINEGFKTKYGGRWHANTVKKVLDNSVYNGWLKYGGLKIKRDELVLI